MSNADAACLMDLIAWIAFVYGICALIYGLMHLPGSLKYTEDYIIKIGIGIAAGIYLKMRH